MEITEAELQAKIEAAVNEATSGLSSKNKELLIELKDTKRKLNGSETVEMSKFNELQDEFDALKTNYSSLEKKYKSETEQLNTALESTKSGYFNSIKESELNSALAKANIAPHFFDAVKALHLNTVETVEKDGKLSAMVGDKSITEFLGEWVNTDVGKHYVLAPNNNGGGASGSNGKTASIDTSNLSPIEKMKQGRQQT